MASTTADWTEETTVEIQMDNYSTDATTTSSPPARSSAASILIPYNIALLFFGIMGTLVSVFVLVGIWLSDRSNIKSSTLYIANHTTLELVSCVMMTVRYAMAVAGVFVYRNSGTAAMALCILIDGAIVLKAAMYGGIISVVIITLDRYWKIVHPIHHRKYYRRWMAKVGLIIPWLSGVATQFPQISTTAIIRGRCSTVAVWPTISAKIVSSRFLFLF